MVLLMSASRVHAQKKKKVIVIGLDGAEWEVMRPLIKKGELKNIERLIEKGSEANLTSTRPSMSPVAWTTFSTGKNPGKHGIFSFLRRKDGEFIPLTSKNVRSKRVWNLASQKNLTSIVINVPMTYPPKPLKGKLISGYLSIENTTWTYPESLQATLEKEGYKIEALSGGFEEGKGAQFLEALNKTVNKRTEVALDLMKEKDWNLFILVYTGLDRLQHYFWKYRGKNDSEFKNVIRGHYKKLDRQVGKLLKNKEKGTKVIIMSDHGFGELKGEVYLNHWLRKQGYLKLEKKRGLLSKLGLTQQNLISFLRSINLFKPIKWLFKKLGIYKFGKKVPKPSLSDIDFNRTKAYVVNFGGGIYITAENYTKVRNEIQSKLKNLENPRTGEKFFTEVKRKEAIYNGEMIEEAPDLIVDSRYWDPVGFLGYGKLFSTSIKKSGKHRNEGILVTNFKIEKGNHSLHDITPTILDLLQVESKENFDGKSLVK